MTGFYLPPEMANSLLSSVEKGETIFLVWYRGKAYFVKAPQKATRREIAQKWIDQLRAELNELQRHEPYLTSHGQRANLAQQNALKNQIEDLERQLAQMEK